MDAFLEADCIYVRNGIATRFGLETAKVKLEDAVPTAFICLYDDDSFGERV